MMLTRRGLASVLVALLFLGCAASPNTGGVAPESGTAAERNRAAMERPADPIAYLHLVRAHYYAEAAEWPACRAQDPSRFRPEGTASRERQRPSGRRMAVSS